MDNKNEACRRLLLDELGLLKGMYTMEELEVNESQDPAENGQVTQLILRQQVDGINYEVVIHLSNEYPIILKPSAFIRCSLINCNLLNQELRYFIDQETLSVPLILAIVQWISDNISRFKVFNYDVMTSYGIYVQSYRHLRREGRPKTIMLKYKKALNDIQRSFKVTVQPKINDGFGKPGVIILEGSRTDCDKFWKQIRVLNWQHIALRYCEEQSDPSFLRLGKFREIQFQHTKYLAELKKVLIEANLEYGFSLLLNL